MNIEEALKALSPENDDHWTVSGEPRLDRIRSTVGNPAIGRDAVIAAAPGFSRSTAKGYEFRPEGDDANTGATPAEAAEPASVPEVSENGNADNNELGGDGSTEETELTEVDERTRLKAEADAAEKHLAELRVELSELQTAIAKGTEYRDSRLARIQELSPRPHVTNQMAIMQALKSSQKQRIARAQQRVEITPDSRSPIDRMFASRPRS